MLLRAIPRTASIVAAADATAYELAREPFLTAVLGHAATQRRADGIADGCLAADTELRPGPNVAGTAD